MKSYFGKSTMRLLWLAVAIVVLLAASQAQAFRFVVMADSPQSLDKWPNYNLTPKPALSVKAGMNKELLEYLRGQILALNPRPDMVFFLGDLVTRAVYPDSNGDLHRFLPDWKEIMRLLPENGIKVYVAVGNRDLYGPGGWPPEKVYETEFQEFFSEPPFDMPDNGPDHYRRLAYSFTHDNAFFVVLDTFGFRADGTNWDNGLDEEQFGWFSDQARDSDARFKFVLSHGPAFSPQGWPVDSSMRTMWGIMEQFSFNAYFCGHEHTFSRWLIDDSVDPTITRSMIQTLTGSAGAYPDDPSSFKNKEMLKKAHVWSGYNYVVVDVNDRTAIQRAYGVTKESGEYKAKLIDKYTFGGK